MENLSNELINFAKEWFAKTQIGFFQSLLFFDIVFSLFKNPFHILFINYKIIRTFGEFISFYSNLYFTNYLNVVILLSVLAFFVLLFVDTDFPRQIAKKTEIVRNDGTTEHWNIQKAATSIFSIIIIFSTNVFICIFTTMLFKFDKLSEIFNQHYTDTFAFLLVINIGLLAYTLIRSIFVVKFRTLYQVDYVSPKTLAIGRFIEFDNFSIEDTSKNTWKYILLKDGSDVNQNYFVVKTLIKERNFFNKNYHKPTDDLWHTQEENAALKWDIFEISEDKLIYETLLFTPDLNEALLFYNFKKKNVLK